MRVRDHRSKRENREEGKKERVKTETNYRKWCDFFVSARTQMRGARNFTEPIDGWR